MDSKVDQESVSAPTERSVVVSWPKTEVLLMILEREKTLLALSPKAFVATQSSRRKLREYENALIVSRGGNAARIERIEIGGYWGDSRARKLASILTSVRVIHVHFAPETLTVDELKRLVVEYLQYDQERADPYLPQDEALPVVFEQIRAASDFAAIFGAMTLPSASEALDLL